MAVFKSDLFSHSKPEWSPTSHVNNEAVSSLLKAYYPEIIPLSCAPDQSGGLEINSHNLRLRSPSGQFLLKRWSQSSNKPDLERILGLMDWLAREGLPVARPKLFDNRSYVLRHCENLWTFFPFIEGDFFSGKADELESAAGVMGNLIEALKRVPRDLTPPLGPKHLTDDDHVILERVKKSQPQWESIFGSQYSGLIHEYWPLIEQEWTTLRSTPLNSGPILPVHFDLHPHNLLMKHARVVGILDFDSCALMPVGYAVGFAGLKLCRQAVVASDRPDLAKEIGLRFVKSFSLAVPSLAFLTHQFAPLALAEVFRRLAIIFRLNLDRSDRTWNHVLPIQLAHIKECRALFES